MNTVERATAARPAAAAPVNEPEYR